MFGRANVGTTKPLGLARLYDSAVNERVGEVLAVSGRQQWDGIVCGYRNVRGIHVRLLRQAAAADQFFR